MIFASIAMVGVLGAAVMSFMRGPLAASVTITRTTTAEQHLQMAVRLAAMTSATQPSGGDCDGDGFIEPLPHVDAGAFPHPAGGGLVPSNMGASRRDPWGRDYGYCAFDHGSVTNAAGCGGVGQARQVGGNSPSWEVIAVMSAGKDGIFQTSCNDWTDSNADLVPDTALVLKPAGSDDILMTWTYAEATAGAGGLWQLEQSDSTTAEIDRNLSVKDGGGVEQLSFDAASAALAIGAGGSGSFPTVRADYMDSLTNPRIEFLTDINATGAYAVNGVDVIDGGGQIVSGEQDPKIGTVEDGKWCRGGLSGVLDCDEDQPTAANIGIVEDGRFCTGAAGGIVNCQSTGSSGGGGGSVEEITLVSLNSCVNNMGANTNIYAALGSTISGADLNPLGGTNNNFITLPAGEYIVRMEAYPTGGYWGLVGQGGHTKSGGWPNPTTSTHNFPVWIERITSTGSGTVELYATNTTCKQRILVSIRKI